MAIVPGLTPPIVSMLESFNVETARDVEQLSLSGIPNVDATIILEMIQWRAALERQFEFKPDHGVTEQQIDAAEKLATQRFKQVQARKVLMGSSQLDQMAQSAECELQYALKRFDQLADHTRALAHQLRDAESSRRNLERTVNSSSGMLITLIIAIPVVGALLWFALG